MNLTLPQLRKLIVLTDDGSRVSRHALVILVVAGLALSVSACTPRPRSGEEPAAQSESTIVAPGANVTGKALPEDFPGDVPLWPGAEVTKATLAGSGSGKQYTVDFETDDPYAAVVDGTLRGLESAGWQITAQEDMSSESASAGLVAFTKGNVEVVDVLAAPDGRTTISLVVTVGK